MGEQVCMTGTEYCGGAVGVDAGGYPVETTGNAALDILEHRSSTRAFARDDDDRPVAVTDEQRAAILACGEPRAVGGRHDDVFHRERPRAGNARPPGRPGATTSP